MNDQALSLALHAARTGDPDDVLVLGDALEEAFGINEPLGFWYDPRVLGLCVRRQRRGVRNVFGSVAGHFLYVTGGWRSKWSGYGDVELSEFSRRLRRPSAFSTRANRRFARAVAAVLMFGGWSAHPWLCREIIRGVFQSELERRFREFERGGLLIPGAYVELRHDAGGFLTPGSHPAHTHGVEMTEGAEALEDHRP